METVTGSLASCFWPKARSCSPPSLPKETGLGFITGISLTFTFPLSLSLPHSWIPAVSRLRLCKCCNNWSPLPPPSLNSVSEEHEGPQTHHTVALKTDLKEWGSKYNLLFFFIVFRCLPPSLTTKCVHNRNSHAHTHTHRKMHMLGASHARSRAHANKRPQQTTPCSPQKHTHKPSFRGHHRAPYS